MSEVITTAPSETEQKFIVRIFDGMDHEWTDVSEPVSKGEADRIWNEKTKNGTELTSFNDIDYYRIFPADTKMVFSDGHSMIADR